MKHLLLTTIAAVVLVGCGPSEADRALFKAAAGVELGDTSVRFSGESEAGNIEAVKQHLAAGADVNAKDERGKTPLDLAIQVRNTKTSALLRKHGGKTAEELKAEGK